MKKILWAFLALFLGACSSSESLTQLITIKDQKMGIATKNPDQRLTVNGGIHAKEVIVDLNGALAPDYVFTEFNGQPTTNNYRRMPLDQLKTYVQNNGHLPGVPSHEVLNRNGLDLKAFSLTLLEKIEELTLYLIQQQSQIESLEAALKQNTNLALDKTTIDQEKNPLKKSEN